MPKLGLALFVSGGRCRPRSSGKPRTKSATILFKKEKRRLKKNQYSLIAAIVIKRQKLTCFFINISIDVPEVSYVEAAHLIVRFCPEANAFYQQKKARTNGAIATKALANKLARATFCMMRDQTMFDVKKVFR